jgi:hypothetical protein
MTLVSMRRRAALGGYLLFAITIHGEARAQALLDEKLRKEVGNIAATRTVKVLGSGTPGSGVLIGKNGSSYTVLTAGHVIEGTSIHEEPEVMTFDGKRHAITKVRRGACLDIAEIVFTSTDSYPVAKYQKERVKVGEPFVVAGFSSGSFKVGLDREVIGISGNEPTDAPGGYTLAYPSINSRVGWSGGGLYSSKGELIGIHGRAQTSYYAWQDLPLVPKLGQGQGPIKFAIPIAHWLSTGLLKCSPSSQAKNAEQKATRLLLQGLHSMSEGDYAKAIKLFNEGKALWPYSWFDLALARANDDLGISDKASQNRVFDRFYRALSVVWTWPNDRNSEHCTYMKDYPLYAVEYNKKYNNFSVIQFETLAPSVQITLDGLGGIAAAAKAKMQRDVDSMREWFERNCK